MYTHSYCVAIGLLDCWLVGWYVGSYVDWLVVWLVFWLVAWLVRWLVGKATSITEEVCGARTMHIENNPVFFCVFAVWPCVCCAVGVVTF